MTNGDALTREEWSRRFAARIMEIAGWDERAAMRCAAEAADQHEQNEREVGDTVDWLDPEEEADVEMSYWTDDGDD